MDSDENKPTTRTAMRRKSSNRRSSILKKRPLTPINTSDTDITERTTVLKTRGKRVSFSETYEVKLFPKDSPKQWMNEINRFNDVADENKQESEKGLEASEAENTLTGLNSLLTAQINHSLLSGQAVLEQEQNQDTRSCQSASKIQEDDGDKSHCNPDDVELTSCQSGASFQSKPSPSWEETTTKLYSASTLEVTEVVYEVSVNQQSLAPSDIFHENEQTRMFDETMEMTQCEKIDATEFLMSLDTKTPKDPCDSKVEQRLVETEKTRLFDDSEEDLSLTCTLSPTLNVSQDPVAMVMSESATIFADDRKLFTAVSDQNEQNWSVSTGKSHIIQDDNDRTEAFDETMELTPCEIRTVACAKPEPKTSTLAGVALSMISVDTPEKIDATSFLMSLAAKQPKVLDEGETKQWLPSPNKTMAFNDSDEDLSLTCTHSPSLAVCQGSVGTVMTDSRAVFTENEQLSKGITLGFSTPDKIDARTFLNSLTSMSSKEPTEDARFGLTDLSGKTNLVDHNKLNCASDQSLTQMCVDKENNCTQVFSEPMEMTECIALSESQPSEQAQVSSDDSNQAGRGTPDRLTAAERTRIFNSDDVDLSLTCVQPVHSPPDELNVESGSIPAKDKRSNPVPADRTVIFENTVNDMELTKIQSVGADDELLRTEDNETETSQTQATPTDRAEFSSVRTNKPHSVSERPFKSQSVSLRKGLSKSIFLKRSHAETNPLKSNSSQVNTSMPSFTKASSWPNNTKTSTTANEDGKTRSSTSIQSQTQMCVDKENNCTQVFSEPMEMTECIALSESQPSEQAQVSSDDSNQAGRGTPDRLTAAERTRIFNSDDVDLSLTCVQPVHSPPDELNVESGSIPAKDKRSDPVPADRTVIFENTVNDMELTKVQSVGADDELLRTEDSEIETSQTQATPTDRAEFSSVRTNKPHSVSERPFKSQSVSLRKGLSKSIFLKRSHAETNPLKSNSSQVNTSMPSFTKASSWPNNTKTSTTANEDGKTRSSTSIQSQTQMCVDKENNCTQVFSEPMEMTECIALSESQPSEQAQVSSDDSNQAGRGTPDRLTAAERTRIFNSDDVDLSLTCVQPVHSPPDELNVESGSIPAKDKRSDPVPADRTVIFENTVNDMELTKIQSVGADDELLRTEDSETETSQTQATPTDRAEFSSMKTNKLYSASLRTNHSEPECTLQTSQPESVSLKKDHPETESSEGSPLKPSSKKPRMETTFSSAPLKLAEDATTADSEGLHDVAKSESRSVHEESVELPVADQMAITFTMSSTNNLSCLVTRPPEDDDNVIFDNDDNDVSKSLHFSIMRDRTASTELEETSVFFLPDKLDCDSQPPGGSCEDPSIKNDLAASNPDPASNPTDRDMMTTNVSPSPNGSTPSSTPKSSRKQAHDSASDKDVDTRQGFFNSSQCSRSATSLDKSSVIRFLGDESEQILMPEYDVKSVDDCLNVFGVIIPRKACSRNSVTTIPVDAPQVLADYAKLEVTKSELEISKSAQHQLSDLIDKYRNLNVRMEEEIGPKLPELMEKMLANFNENFERTQKLSAACSKKVKKYLKEWKLDVLRHILEANTNEKELITTVREQLHADLSQIQEATEQMKQKLCELDQMKVAEEQLKEEEAELHRIRTELAQKQAELTAVQDKHQKIKENISELKAVQAKYSKESTRPVKEKTDRLLRCVAYQLQCLQTDHIVLSFLDQSLVLDIEMEMSSQQSPHHIKHVSLSSVIKESHFEEVYLKEIYNTKLIELCHQIIKRSLPEERLTGLSTTGYEFRKVLVDLSVLTSEVERWMKYLTFVAVKHRVSYTDSSVTIMFSNREVDAMFQVTFDLDLSNFLTAAPKVTAKRILGSIQPDDVLRRLSSIKHGPDFIRTAIGAIYKDVMRLDSKLYI